MFWILMGGFAVLMVVAICIYLMPTEAARPKKKERRPLIPDPVKSAPADKDWKAIAERWEKSNNALMGDIEKLKMQERKSVKTLEEHQLHAKDLLDKLALEKSWREKEQANLDKARHNEKELKEQIVRTEKELEREHSERLRAERGYQELKIKHDATVEERRVLSTKAMSLQTTVETQNKELKELRSENVQLKKKREDIQWVAKSEFDDVKKELERLKQIHGA